MPPGYVKTIREELLFEWLEPKEKDKLHRLVAVFLNSYFILLT
jgi:hypothetical protein